jgi:hypothetical protein
VRKISFLIAAAGCVGASQAQVMQFAGEPSNQAFRLDFDTPLVASGPIAGNAAPMVNNGIRNISLVGPWTTGTDVITASSNASGQSLVSNFGGRLGVAGVGESLDNPGAGAGFDIILQAPTNEFGVLFIDQINFSYDIELFLGAAAIARVANFNYGGSFPSPGHYWNEANGLLFDRILITFPTGTGGVGIDNIAIGATPAGCYPDCDTSTGVGVLDIFDFLCFQNAFVAGDPYACDCDTSTGPICDILDFLCFQNAFVAGCP